MTGKQSVSARPRKDEAVFERLHHMQLAMPRAQESTAREFYSGVLGLLEIDKPPVLAARGGAWFRAGGVELHLGVENDFRPVRKGHPGLLVNDLDGIVARLAASGQRAASRMGHRLPWVPPDLRARPVRQPAGVPATVAVRDPATGHRSELTDA